MPEAKPRSLVASAASERSASQATKELVGNADSDHLGLVPRVVAESRRDQALGQPSLRRRHLQPMYGESRKESVRRKGSG